MTKLFQHLREYFKNSAQEFKKVNWPTSKETIRYTLGVIGFSLIVALILGFVDFGLIQSLKIIIT